MRIGGVSAADLAQAYGTPLLAIDYDVLDRAVASFLDACEPYGIEVAYAGKALLLTALAKHLKHTRLQLDVCSLGELAAAERAGFPPERLTLHGCGKTDDELDAALEGRVGRIAVDNLDELHRLKQRASGTYAVDVLLRINTGIEAHTHAFVRTAGSRSKFGFDPHELPKAIDVLKDAQSLHFTGLHGHIGSQIYESQAFVEHVLALMERAAYCAHAGLKTEVLIAGGGFGVGEPDRAPMDPALTAKAIAQTGGKEARRWNIPVPRIGIEPGRALIAQAGTSVYSVMAVKRQFERAYAIVDGGMYENPRPALYNAYHHIVCASRDDDTVVEMTVCGRTCENDELGVAKLPSTLRAGDLIAVQTTGAYTYSMASNYNRFTRPAVIAVRQGTHTPIARRETIEDVLRVDCDA